MTVTSASGHAGLVKGLMKIKMVWILCYCLHSHQISTLFGKRSVRQDSPPLPSKNQMRNIYRSTLLSWSQFQILGFTVLSHDQGIPVFWFPGFLHTWSAALHVAVCSRSSPDCLHLFGAHQPSAELNSTGPWSPAFFPGDFQTLFGTSKSRPPNRYHLPTLCQTPQCPGL